MKMLQNTGLMLRGIGVAGIFLFMVALLIPVAITYKYLAPSRQYDVPQLFHRCLLKLLGIKVDLIGAPSQRAPVLFVANHSSYLDIIILGAVLPTAFVAKSEVAGWPLFGILAKIQNTVFVERRPLKAAQQQLMLKTYFADGQKLVLFPEGTSSNGLTTLPFKSSLFGILEDAAAGQGLTIQPVSITCTKLDNHLLSRQERDFYAWYGDMTLLPHLWRVFKNGHFTVEVRFHPVLTAEQAADRKTAAKTCQMLVAHGIERSLAYAG